MIVVIVTETGKTGNTPAVGTIEEKETVTIGSGWTVDKMSQHL